jgi:hypothetical protein
MKPTTLSKNPNPLLSYILPLSSDNTFTSLSEDSSRHHQAEQQVNLSVSPIFFFFRAINHISFVAKSLCLSNS